MSWISHFDNTNWIAPSSANISTFWISGSNYWEVQLFGGTSGARLETIGNWFKSYRPTKVRININDSTSTLNINSSGGNVITSASPYLSASEIDMTFATSAASSDVYHLDLNWGTSPNQIYKITNIEFFEGSSSSSSMSSCFIGPDDDFTVDGVPDVQRWETSGSALVSGGGFSILNLEVDNTTHLSLLNSRFQVTSGSDFLAQIPWQIYYGANSGIAESRLFFEVRKINDPDNRLRIGIRNSDTTYIEEAYKNSVLTSNTVPTTATSGSFRLERSGNQWQSYYRDGSTFTMASSSGIGLGEVEFRLYAENDTNFPEAVFLVYGFTLTGDIICPTSSSSSSSSSSESSSSSSESSSSSSESSSSSSSSESSTSSSSKSSSSSSSSSFSISFSSSSQSSSSSSSTSVEPDGFTKHFWFELRDINGKPISDADIWIYRYQRSDIPITIYEDDACTSLLAQPFQTTSGGVISFYVKDWILDETSDGQPWERQFTIKWVKDDKSGTVDGDHLFGEFTKFKLSSNNTKYNRTISNFYGNKWNTHTTTKRAFDSDTVPDPSPHDLQLVSYESTDPKWNKIFSNFKMNQLMYSLVDAAFPYIKGDGVFVKHFPVEVSDWTLSTSPSGLYYYVVNHFFDNLTPQIVCWYKDNKEVYEPEDIEFLNTRRTRVWVVVPSASMIVAQADPGPLGRAKRRYTDPCITDLLNLMEEQFISSSSSSSSCRFCDCRSFSSSSSSSLSSSSLSSSSSSSFSTTPICFGQDFISEVLGETPVLNEEY